MAEIVFVIARKGENKNVSMLLQRTLSMRAMAIIEGKGVAMTTKKIIKRKQLK